MRGMDSYYGSKERCEDLTRGRKETREVRVRNPWLGGNSEKPSACNGLIEGVGYVRHEVNIVILVSEREKEEIDS